MRRLFIFVSVAATVAACADQQQPTSPLTVQTPADRQVGVSTSVADAAGVKVPQAKPTDQVGFTKVQIVEGESVTVIPNTFNGAAALCPAGSWAVGGTYQLSSVKGTPPLVDGTFRTTIVLQTGWLVDVNNTQLGSGPLTLSVQALCAS